MDQCGGRIAVRGHLEGRPQRRLTRSIRKSPGRQGSLFSGLGSQKHGHEFVAAEPGEQACGACGLPQPFGSGMKHRIASQEAIPFVDRLQADDVQNRDGHQLPGLPWGLRSARGSAVFGEGGFEYAPRRETGDVVVHECPQGCGEAGGGLEEEMETKGIEPSTPALQRRCSPN